ncbi:Ig-like domain-containing protein, partial [bacterium]|nr:Ig-like domain-containing protein [bacterium]
MALIKVEDDDFTVDLSSIIAFGGDKLGIIWGNQNPDIDHEQRRYYFSVHSESDPDTVWQPREDVLPGLSAFDPDEHIADDHLNLACPGDGGMVLAAVKTGVNDAGFPFVCVSKRSVSGTWTYSTYGTPAQAHTRPTILFDSDTDSVYVFAKSEQQSQEAIYMKSSHIDNLTFSQGFGTVFLHSDTTNNISNPTSTKQCVDGATGILLLASDRTSEHYFHNYMSPGNQSPIAVGESAITHRDTPVSIDPLANDLDSDGTLNVATLALVRSPKNGTATIDSVTGLVLYTPSQGFAGLDTLKYTVRDNDDVSAVAATVAIFVNQIPTASDDAVTGDEDTPTSIAVVANDLDPDGTLDLSTLAIVEPPRHGTASIDTVSGLIIYSPEANFMAIDTLRYTIDDNHGATSNPATVTVAIANINDPPFVVSDTTLAHQGIAVEIDVLANDSDLEGAINLGSVGIGVLPDNGTVAVNPGNGTISYLSNGAFFGTDSFTYTVADEEGARSGEALVVVNVNALPVAAADTVVTHKNSLLVFDTHTNDIDPDGNVEPATLQIVVAPANGLAVVDVATGEITYSPTTDFVGQDGLSYTVHDNDGGVSNIALVRIKVNAPPVAHPDSVIAIQGIPLNIQVLGNDTDSDGVLDSTTVAISSQALNGSAAVDSTSGVVIYTPNPGFAGNDLFQYAAQDNDGAMSNTATVSVRVNIPPIANNDLITTDEEVGVVIDVTANDNDIDGSLVLSSVVLVSSVNNGTLTLN